VTRSESPEIVANMRTVYRACVPLRFAPGSTDPPRDRTTTAAGRHERRPSACRRVASTAALRHVRWFREVVVEAGVAAARDRRTRRSTVTAKRKSVWSRRCDRIAFATE
jgi:hypothetical protein